MVGVIAITAAGAVLLLPETKGHPLVETIEETQDLKNECNIEFFKEIFNLSRLRRKSLCKRETDFAMHARSPNVPIEVQSHEIFIVGKSNVGRAE